MPFPPSSKVLSETLKTAFQETVHEALCRVLYPDDIEEYMDAQLYQDGAKVREFATGATRDSDDEKPDYRGYLSPVALKRFGQYMLKHQIQTDGKKRDSDNWKKGIPTVEYLSSLLRHVIDAWVEFEKNGESEQFEELLCAVFFNVQGPLHIISKRKEKPCQPAGFTKTGAVS